MLRFNKAKVVKEKFFGATKPIKIWYVKVVSKLKQKTILSI